MTVLITILFVLTSFLLVGVVLIQQPKTSGGLFSGTGQSLLGTGGKTFWTKFTVIVAAVFMTLCLILSVIPRLEKPGSSIADIIEKQQQAAHPGGAAQAGTAPAQAASDTKSNPAPQAVPGLPNPSNQPATK
jgi:preprotein translocase subunit SecG